VFLVSFNIYKNKIENRYGMSGKKVIPPWIYCVRCGSRVELVEDTSPEALENARKQGYTAIARGICECGVVYVLCYQPLPASPTFSLFFDVYPAEAVREILISRKSKVVV
jgi:hypothetical protein